ncbi:MAG: hypothetical protein OXG15_09220 [Gammaproteobacteria bacterium]|nr:hypothetical protein [Gammaproteobacteria bacterium]
MSIVRSGNEISLTFAHASVSEDWADMDAMTTKHANSRLNMYWPNLRMVVGDVTEFVLTLNQSLPSDSMLAVKKTGIPQGNVSGIARLT